jgi:hypothetical protein
MRKECYDLNQQLKLIRDILLEGRPVETKFFTDGGFVKIVFLAKNCNCIDQELQYRISDLSSNLETHPHKLADEIQDIIDIISKNCS